MTLPDISPMWLSIVFSVTVLAYMIIPVILKMFKNARG